MNEDTVKVRLTPAGVQAANGGTLNVHGGRVEVSIKADQELDVHLTTWTELLKTTAPAGKPYFELVPATAKPAGKSPAPQLVPPAGAAPEKS